MSKFKKGFDSDKDSRVRYFKTKFGLPSVDDINNEVIEMLSVLAGQTDPPVELGVPTLMEVAEAYHLRASELSIRILQAEQNGDLKSGDQYVKLRTGILRVFIETVRKSIDLGSRRLTAAQYEWEKTNSKWGEVSEDE